MPMQLRQEVQAVPRELDSAALKQNPYDTEPSVASATTSGHLVSLRRMTGVVAGELAPPTHWRHLVALPECPEAASLRGCQQRELTAPEQPPEVSIEAHEVLTQVHHGCRQPGIGQVVAAELLGKAQLP